MDYLLTDQEAKVFRLIRSGDYRSVKISFANKREMDFAEVEQIQKVDKYARFTDLIMKDGYHEITLKTKKGEVVHCKNIRRIKILKNDGTGSNQTN